jgi:hypothetical protein
MGQTGRELLAGQLGPGQAPACSRMEPARKLGDTLHQGNVDEFLTGVAAASAR